MSHPLLQWIAENPAILAVLAGVSLVTFVGTLVVVPVLLVRMRADYFLDPDPATSFHRRHPALRAAGAFAKNVIGATLVVIGFLLLLLPGQGILSILVGLSLLDFPGKRRLERRIAMQRHVRRSIDWIRTRRGHPPLRFDEEDPPNTLAPRVGSGRPPAVGPSSDALAREGRYATAEKCASPTSRAPIPR